MVWVMNLSQLLELPSFVLAQTDAASVVDKIDTSRFDDWSFWVVNAVILVGGFIVLSIVMRLLRMLCSRADTTVPLKPIFSVLKWIGMLVIVGLVLERFQLEIMTIITTTLAMVAIGVVAVWSLLSHVLATFLLMTTKPFRVNDTVGFVGEEVKGRVVDLNLFYTTLRISEDEHIQVPNNMFFQKALKISRGKDETELSTQFGRDQPAEDEGQSEKKNEQ